MEAIDFSTYNVKAVTPDEVRLLRAQAELLILGYDDAPESHAVRNAFMAGGFSLWDVYRYDYPSLDIDAQVASVLTAVHHSPEPLPGYVHLDIEETGGQAPTILQIERAMDDIEAGDVKPSGTLVKPSIYTGQWVWDAHYQGYTGPADRGWALWTTARGGTTPDTVQLYGGWKREQVIGVQHTENAQIPGVSFLVDISTFRARTGPAPQTGGLGARLDAVIAELQAIRGGIQ